jgi:FSR family fosmidomycin resistance protein-like MFS transporter
MPITTDGRARDASAFDRVGLLSLAAGHFVVDMVVGALPALLPLFVREYRLSDLAASMILGASLLASSAVQPVFGVIADRRAAPWLLYGGVAVGAVLMAFTGLMGTYLAVMLMVVVSGLGIAGYHPEAARVANRLSGGRPATGLAWFMVGGNAGFAAGPLVAAAAIPFLGLQTTLVFIVPGLAIAAWLFLQRSRLAVPVAHVTETARLGDPHVPGLSLLLVVTTLRTWSQFTLLALAPLLLVKERGLSEQAGSLAVFAFSFAGAVGTIGGARIADRFGGRRMLVWTLPPAAPLMAGVPLLPTPLAIVSLTGAGLVLMASFSVTVAMGQEYLPRRLALAAGLMIGFGAIGSAPPGLAIFGALADAAGRETALLVASGLPLAAGALSLMLPHPRPAPVAA